MSAFKTVTVRGIKIDVSISPAGHFEANFGSQSYSRPTLDGLLDVLQKATKVTGVSVPFRRWQDTLHMTPGLRLGAITGIHAKTNALLVKWDGEKGSDQENSWTGIQGREYLQLTDEEAAEYTALRMAQIEAKKAADDFSAAHRIDARASIEAAMKEAEKND
jgi:hypothetical protein